MSKNNSKLEAAMQLAADGSRQAAYDFYAAFLEGTLFIPERFQESPLSNAPQYPDDFFNILGIKSYDKTYVPVFSKPEMIEQWCGNTFKYRQMSGKELLKLLPEDWWCVVNPSQEIEKELSAWELKHLKSGAESINELVAEVFIESISESVEVEPLKGSDYPALKRAMIEAGTNNKSIKSIYMLKEVSRDSNDYSNYTALIGVEVDDLQSAIQIKDQLTAIANECQIGNDPARVIAGISVDETLMLGVFKGYEPIYKRAQIRSFFARLFNFQIPN